MDSSVLTQVADIFTKRQDRALRIKALHDALSAALPDERVEFLAGALERFALPPAADAATPHITLRDAVLGVLGDSRALSTADIFDAVLETLPTAKKGSIASTVTHMKRQGMIARRGRGPRGALYVVTEAAVVPRT